MGTVLCIAPHPDDEVLGVGGTLLRHLHEGDPVHVVICTKGREPRFDARQIATVQAEAREVHSFLGVTGGHFLDFPAAELDRISGADLADALLPLFERLKPDTVYISHVGDVHRDHQIVFQAAMVCVRPTQDERPSRILAYETVSETDWYAPPITPPFAPNVFVDITNYMEKKLEACSLYASQMRKRPHQRSAEALRSLSASRGYMVGVEHAEAFMLVRQVIDGKGKL